MRNPAFLQVLRGQKASKLQEKRVAQSLAGRRTPASGASTNPHMKGDVAAASFLVECKTTEKKGYRLTAETLEKIIREAYQRNKVPVLQIDLGGRSYAVLLYQDFHQISYEAGYIK